MCLLEFCVVKAVNSNCLNILRVLIYFQNLIVLYALNDFVFGLVYLVGSGFALAFWVTILVCGYAFFSGFFIHSSLSFTDLTVSDFFSIY